MASRMLFSQVLFRMFHATRFQLIKGIYQVIDPAITVVNFLAASIWDVATAGSQLFLNRKFGVKN